MQDTAREDSSDGEQLSDDGECSDVYAMAVDALVTSNGNELVTLPQRISMEVRFKLHAGGDSKHIVGLLDTGSTSSTIISTLVVSTDVDTSRPTRYAKIDGSIGTSLGHIVVPFRLSDFSPTRIVSQKFKVVPSLVYPVVLGLDFMMAQGMVLDFANKTIHWDGLTMRMKREAAAVACDTGIKDADYSIPSLE
ncbi:hypothetical protein AC1031_005905 [Aphanomyces cochlioides]|nr:hypothetical protein AC1031_005905 [Aphanomyces cochlioides]